jgi:hypothetical protein
MDKCERAFIVMILKAIEREIERACAPAERAACALNIIRSYIQRFEELEVSNIVKELFH